MVADFRDDVVSTEVAVLRPDLALHSGPLGRLVAMLRDQEWKGLGQVGEGCIFPKVSHMGFTGFKRGQRCTRIWRFSMALNFREPMF